MKKRKDSITKKSCMFIVRFIFQNYCDKLNQVLKSHMSERFILLSLFTLQVSSTGITDGGFSISLFQLLHDILRRNFWKEQ